MVAEGDGQKQEHFGARLRFAWPFSGPRRMAARPKSAIQLSQNTFPRVSGDKHRLVSRLLVSCRSHSNGLPGISAKAVRVALLARLSAPSRVLGHGHPLDPEGGPKLKSTRARRSPAVVPGGRGYWHLPALSSRIRAPSGRGSLTKAGIVEMPHLGSARGLCLTAEAAVRRRPARAGDAWPPRRRRRVRFERRLS